FPIQRKPGKRVSQLAQQFVLTGIEIATELLGECFVIQGEEFWIRDWWQVCIPEFRGKRWNKAIGVSFNPLSHKMKVTLKDSLLDPESIHRLNRHCQMFL